MTDEEQKKIDEKQKKIFADNLNRYIKMNNKQQFDIARDLKINKTTFNTWCTGNSMPRTGKLRKIADYFNIGMTDLTEERTDKSDLEYSEIVMDIANNDLRFKNLIVKYSELPIDKKKLLCDFFENFVL